MYNIEDFAGTAIMVLIALALMVVPTVFYFISLQKALEAVSPENRMMPPGQVWLSLIPLFNFVWMFFVVNKIAESFQLECQKLGISTTEAKPTQGIGNAKNILRLCSLIPVIGALPGLGFIVCWIIHWVKVNEYRNLILNNRSNTILDAERGIFHQ